MSELKKTVNLAGSLALDTMELNMCFPGTNQPTGWVLTLAGPGHPQTVELSDEMERKRLKKVADIERAQVNGRKYKGDEDLDPEESRRQTVTSICRRIVDWTPVDFGEGPIEFSLDNAVDAFMDRRKAAYFGQLVDKLNEEKAFMKASAKP